jgi:hypothetical protein
MASPSNSTRGRQVPQVWINSGLGNETPVFEPCQFGVGQYVIAGTERPSLERDKVIKTPGYGDKANGRLSASGHKGGIKIGCAGGLSWHL